MCGVDLRFTLATLPLTWLLASSSPLHYQHVVYELTQNSNKPLRCQTSDCNSLWADEELRARSWWKKVVVRRWRWRLSGVACHLRYLFRCNRVNDIQGVEEYDSLQFVSINVVLSMLMEELTHKTPKLIEWFSVSVDLLMETDIKDNFERFN